MASNTSILPTLLHQQHTVERYHDIIRIINNFDYSDLPYLLSNIHHAVEKYAHEELTLDFSNCTGVHAPSLFSLCAQCIKRRNDGHYIHLVLPTEEKTKKLFVNANWAHLIDPRRYDPSKARIQTQIPATQYQISSDQNKVVNRIVNHLLGMVPDMKRTDLEAFEWSINEITDNVLVHSQSNIGGIIQLSFFKNKNIVQYMVADAGIGIPSSMRSNEDYQEKDDVDALNIAIREGVTRDTSIGQGNGLYGSYQISNHCNASFEIRSGYARLSLSKGVLSVKKEKIPYTGTFVMGEINFSMPELLQDALKFGGKKRSTHYDFIDSKYERDDDFYFKLEEETDSVGSRIAGTPVRNKIKNLYSMHYNKKIIIDFENIGLMSSSFADEVFGKLFKDIGPMSFMQRIHFKNIAQTCNLLIDRAISQRMGAN